MENFNNLEGFGDLEEEYYYYDNNPELNKMLEKSCSNDEKCQQRIMDELFNFDFLMFL